VHPGDLRQLYTDQLCYCLFAKFQLDTRAEVMGIWSDRRAEMFEKNDASRKKLERLKAKQQTIIETLRTKSDADEKELAVKTATGEGKIAEAELNKKETLKSNDDTLASLKADLSSVERRLKEENELLSVLEHHKHVLQAEWSSQIANLTQTITDLEEDFRAELNGLDRQFRMKTLQFEGDVDSKMAKTKRDASDKALMHQPAVDKIAYSDNGWLRHEIGEQQDELVRARDVVEDLHKENKALLRKVYGAAAGDGGHAAKGGRSGGGADTVAEGMAGMSIGLGSRQTSSSSLRSGGTGSKQGGWMPQSRPTTRQGGSRPSSRPASRQASSARPMSRSGFRAAATLDPEELEAIMTSKSSDDVIGNLRIFPAMAKSGEGARVVGMRKKKAETSSLFPLPQVSARGQTV